MRRALPYLLLAAALAGVLASRGRRVPRRYSVEHEVAPVAALAPPGRPVEAERGDALGRQGGATARRSLPPSLAGTVADGELAVDESGRLVVTRETRRFFDYFLAGGGEEGVGRARARLVAEVRKRLPVSAVPEAIGLLDRYLAYRRRARLAEQAPDVGARVSLLHALREQALGAEAARAFFADEEAADEAAIERARISADPSLDAAERGRRAARLEERLPEPVREARAQALAPLRLMQDEERLRASGASPAEIRALRERSFGAEAADRLEDLDRQRAAWQRRLDDYREARDAIARSDSLDAGARDRAIETLRAERFTPEERLRVVALDRIRETER